MNIYCPAACVYLAPHEYQVSVHPSIPLYVACTRALFTVCLYFILRESFILFTVLCGHAALSLADCSRLLSPLVYVQLWGQAQPQYPMGAGAGVVGVGALSWVT